MKCNWRLWHDSRQGETYLVGVNISLLLEMWRRVMMLALQLPGTSPLSLLRIGQSDQSDQAGTMSLQMCHPSQSSPMKCSFQFAIFWILTILDPKLNFFTFSLLLTGPKLILFLCEFSFSWLTMAFTRAVVTSLLAVMEGRGGGLNWISNLIKHLTLDHSFRFSGHQSAWVKYSRERAGDSHESRAVSWLLFPMSDVTRDELTSHNQPVSRYSGRF